MSGQLEVGVHVATRGNMSQYCATSSDHVEGLSNYLEHASERPVVYLYEAPPGVPNRSGRSFQHTMWVFDGPSGCRPPDPGHRRVRVHATRERGRELLRPARGAAASTIPEVAQLVEQATEAARVQIVDHNVRSSPMAKEGINGAREPVEFAHIDYTPKSGPQYVRDLMGVKAEQLLRHQFAEINLWRAIRGPVEELLARCDAQSMSLSDFVPTDPKYHDRTGEVYSRPHNPNHRWYYFPKMQRNEDICSSALIRRKMAAPALPRILPAMIRPVLRMRLPGKV
jgi:hypothetical protein